LFFATNLYAYITKDCGHKLTTITCRKERLQRLGVPSAALHASFFVQKCAGGAVLWNRNYILRFRFRLLKSYGSRYGSDFEHVLVPVPDPYLVFRRSKAVFKKKITFLIFTFLMLIEAVMLPRKLSSHLFI
jgi:hypothetical protein